MSDLPAGWVETTIGDVVEPKVEQRTPLENEHFYYIDISSIDRTAKKIVNPQKLSGKDAPSRARQVVASGDVLVSMTRPNLNAVAMVSDDLDKQIASTGFDVLRAKGVDSRWLYYLVRTNDFVTAMSDLVQGALYPAVRPRDIRKFEIPLAPLGEQKRIAEKLDSLLTRVDSCERHLERVPQILKRFRQSVLAAATSGRLTEDWREEKGVDNSATELLQAIANAQNEASIKVRGGAIEPSLGDLPDEVDLPQGWVVAGFDFLAAPEANALKAGPFGSTLKKNMYVPHGYKIYGQEQVIAGDENFGDYFIDEAKYQELITCAVKPGDILISLVGTIGKVLVLSDNSKPGIINPRLVKLSLYKSINRKYISLYLQSPLARHFFESKSHGGTMDILNLGILRELPVLIPSLEEQAEIVRRVESLFAYAERLEARYLSASERVARLTPSMLGKGFRGELVEQDPNDEPAEKLLERVKAGREDVQPQKAGPRGRKGSK